MQGLGSRVGCYNPGAWFMASGLVLGVLGLGVRVQGSWFSFVGVLVVGCIVQGAECELHGLESVVLGLPVQGFGDSRFECFAGVGRRVQVAGCNVQAVWVCISPFMDQS
jgi:hypothetical protein